MQKISLTAQSRTVFGKKLSQARATGQLPAIVYGQDQANEPIFLNAHDFSRTYSQAGHNTIIELKIDQDKSSSVLIHDVTHHSVTGDLTHADLYRLNMSKSIRTTVPVHFTGEAPAVYQDEGTLLTNIEEVEVETLPAKLPSSIDVDISVLDDFEKSIHVRDLPVPEGVEILVDGDELVAKVDPPRSQDEIDALDEDIVEEIPAEEGEEGTEGSDEEGDKPEGGDDAKSADKKE